MEAIQQKAPLRDGRNVRDIHMFQVDFMFEIRNYFFSHSVTFKVAIAKG